MDIRDITITKENRTLHIDDCTKTILSNNLIYCSILVGISLLTILCLRLDCYLFGPVINEASVTECTQQILLGITSVAFYRISIENPHLKQAALLICGFFLVMFIRELDFLFDYIRHGSWIYPALFVTTISIYNACKNGVSTVLNQLAKILAYPDMKSLLVGVVFLVVFSRLYGMGSFWQSLMGDHYLRAVKNVAEEGIELLCYFLITVSAVTTQFGLKRQSKQMNVNESLSH